MQCMLLVCRLCNVLTARSTDTEPLEKFVSDGEWVAHVLHPMIGLREGFFCAFCE